MVGGWQRNPERLIFVAGVASDGNRALIVGGWTTVRQPLKCVSLADVWELHVAEGCWIQVCCPHRTSAMIYS